MSLPNLSETNFTLLKAVLEVAKQDIDFNKVAEIAGMKTSKYARDQWSIVRKKIVGETATDGTTPKKAKDATPKQAKAATPRKRKAKGEAEANDDDDDDEPTTTKGNKKKKTANGTADAGSKSPVSSASKTHSVIKGEPNEAGEAMDDMTP